MRRAIFMVFLLLISIVAFSTVRAASKSGSVPNEMVVGVEDFKTHVLSDIEESGGHLLEIIPTLKALRVSVAPSMKKSFITAVEKKPGVRYVEENFIFKAVHTPNDPAWSYQWGMRIIQADTAWDIHNGSASVIVAVIDTGIERTHSDLSEHYVSLGYDWVNNDNDPTDDEGHGTHVAGIAAAVMHNEIGVAGVAQVSLMAEKVLGADGLGTSDDVAQGIMHAADAGAKVISISLGGYSHSALVEDACQYAWNKGSILIAAAGNDKLPRKFYPAAYNTVIAVAATDRYDGKASYSNWGDWIELSAPGGDGDNHEDWIFSTYLDNGYAWGAGTSMAAPHVSGLVALVSSYDPTMTNQRLREHLWNTSIDLGTSGKDKYYGYGRINAYAALNQLGTNSSDYLVVRGNDNGICYRGYNGSSWSEWARLPGKTELSPAAAVSGDRLYVVHVGMTGGMFWGSVDLTTSSFSGWTGISGKTALSVGAAVCGGELCVVHVGGNGAMFWGSVNLTTSGFSGWTRILGKTELSLGAAASGDSFHVIHVGITQNMFWGSVNLTTSEFSGWTKLPGKTLLSPTLAASDEKLYVVHVGTTGGMFWGSVDLTTSSFSGWTGISGKTALSVGAAASGDNLHIIHVGMTGGMFWGSVDLTTSEFSGWTKLDGATPSAPALAS